MTFILEFFEFKNWLDLLWKVFLFSTSSLVFVWITASTFSRTKLIIKNDAELKVYFGSLIALGIYSIIVVFFLFLIAIHYKGIDISLWYAMPYLFMLFLSFFFSLDLSNKIRAKILEIKNRGRK
jgi:hypothetical protein